MIRRDGKWDTVDQAGLGHFYTDSTIVSDGQRHIVVSTVSYLFVLLG